MKVTIIGTGRVGSTIAYSLLVPRVVGYTKLPRKLKEIVLLDTDARRLEGEWLDLLHAAKAVNPNNVKIKMGKNMKDVKKSDYIVISAGFAREPNETMDELYTKNFNIVDDIAQKCWNVCDGAVVILVTNPATDLKAVVERYYTNVLIPDIKLDEARWSHYRNWKLVGNAGQQILELKGYTNWGVAAVVSEMIV